LVSFLSFSLLPFESSELNNFGSLFYKDNGQFFLLLCVFPQYTVTEPRKQAYADFYKEYDAMKEFNAMKEAGVFQSVRPSGE